MIRAIIIEDEQDAIELLVNMLQDQHSKTINIVGIAKSISDGKKLIKELSPELIFLDINLVDGSGFELRDDINHDKIKVIFTTAFADHSLAAFKTHAIDYLLKPISYEDLHRAIGKMMENSRLSVNLSELRTLIDKNAGAVSNKINISTSEGIEILNATEIIRVEANGSYCTIHIDKRNPIIVSRPMKDIEENLSQNTFMRVHKSHVINVNYVIKYTHSDGGVIILKDNTNIPVSRRKKEFILARLLGNT